MVAKRSSLPVKAALSFSSTNKSRRQDLYIDQKRARGIEQRQSRFARRKAEDKDPSLREERLRKNKPVTLDQKRVWDEVDDDELGMRVDVERLKRRRVEEERARLEEPLQEIQDDEDGVDGEGAVFGSTKGHDIEDDDSMLGSDGEQDNEDDELDEATMAKVRAKQVLRDSSVAPSTTSTNLDLTPSSLALKFPNLFNDAPPPMPKILITTSLNSTLHSEADLFCTLFPNSNYIRRSAHRYSHKYSLREICKFSANREYTHVVMLREDQKKIAGLTIVCLPVGPTFTFSVSSFIEGKRLPGHGRPTNHYPELLLNNFKTPLGLLTARLFQTLYPSRPEFQGRQVVAVSNSRDFLFLRRFRYIFREKRQSERNALDSEGKELDGVQGIRAGLQELGPRFTMKLRRVDKGIGKAGSEGPDGQPWEWKPKMEKKRTVFNL